MAALDKAIKRPLAAARAANLPEVEAGTWYGTPGLLVRGKGMMRVKDEDTLAVRCPRDQKEVLLEAAPEIYFETDDYKGHAAMLVRLSAIDDAELRRCVTRAWREVAPKKLLAAFEPPHAPIKKPRVTSRRASAPKRKPRNS
ncbi:MAG: MmcQ/YjbR family DNA-binding protein [Hyphomicrobium sp.]